MFRGAKGGAGTTMTDRELQKLSRRELLQLLLDQAKETEQLRVELAAAGEHASEMEKTFQRLRERLDEKDAKIREMGETYDRLRDRLNDKDATIKELNETLQAEREGRISSLSEMGSIAEAALRLNGIFEAAQRAADLYLEKVQEVKPLPAPERQRQNVVVTEAVIQPAASQEKTEPVITPPPGPVVDVEPKVVTPPPPPPVQPVRQQPEPAQTKQEPQKRGFFQRKKKSAESKRKFVFSFGWEQQD